MPGMQSEALKEGGTSPNRLVSAVLSAWESEGASGVSARNLASAAGLPVSSIYHHFGDMEHLLEVSQAEAKRAAERWCDQQLTAIHGQVGGPAALGSLLATLIDDWCETQRTLAFAWRESQLMALRDARHSASRAQWSTLWLGFWQDVCGRLDLADMALGTAWLFEGLMPLHLLRWRRPLDRGALDELCRGWAGWLDGRLAPPSPWFDLARREALALADAQAPVLEDPLVASIMAAAARTIERRGIAGLTHRAVAAEAGVTLGVVSYKFRTSADLLNAAFESIYRRMAPQSDHEPEAVPRLDREDALASFDGGYAQREDVLGMEELLVASAREIAWGGFTAQLRYLRGRTSGRFFQALVGDDRPIAPIDAAIFSAFLMGRGNAYLHSGRTSTRADALPLLARFGLAD